MSPESALVAPVPDGEGPRSAPEYEVPVDEIKRRKRDQRRLNDSTRQLDEWERYRALVDASDEAYELVDIANREARFALILMGALNAVPLVASSRADTVAALSAVEQYVMAGLFMGYAVLVLTFVLRAIEALKPGRFRPHLAGWPANAIDIPAGVRYYEDVVQRSPTEYWAAWQNVRLSQLNAELAVQVHSLALKNDAKHVALRQLYSGLRVMALTLAALIALFVVLAWT